MGNTWGGEKEEEAVPVASGLVWSLVMQPLCPAGQKAERCGVTNPTPPRSYLKINVTGSEAEIDLEVLLEGGCKDLLCSSVQVALPCQPSHEVHECTGGQGCLGS